MNCWFKKNPDVYDQELKFFFDWQEQLGKDCFQFEEIIKEEILYYKVDFSLFIDDLSSKFNTSFIIKYEDYFNLNCDDFWSSIKIYIDNIEDLRYFSNEILEQHIDVDDNGVYFLVQNVVDEQSYVNSYNAVENIVRFLLVALKSKGRNCIHIYNNRVVSLDGKGEVCFFSEPFELGDNKSTPWYYTHPKMYNSIISYLKEFKNEVDYHFSYTKGFLEDNRLYLILDVDVQIDNIVPADTSHKFLVVFGNLYENLLENVKFYPAVPDEDFYSDFHLKVDASGRRFVVLDSSEHREENLLRDSLLNLHKWIVAYYFYRETGIDVLKKRLDNEYWYEKFPVLYQEVKMQYLNFQQNIGCENFEFFEGTTVDGKLFYIVDVKLKIDKLLPDAKWHKFIILYEHDYHDCVGPTRRCEYKAKAYPIEPNENYYYKNGEIFHHVVTDVNGLHYISWETASADINIVQGIMRWLLCFYTWLITGDDDFNGGQK